MSNKILPSYPSTLYLPWKANTKRLNTIASEKEALVIFDNEYVTVEEKIDGANAAMSKVDGYPVIRNRDFILNKGYVKNTPAKKQFASIWNWYYKNEDKFDKLHDLVGLKGVYGEWMVMAHSNLYDSLSSWFIAYDLYDPVAHEFIDSTIAREALLEAGFDIVPLLSNYVDSYEQLEKLANQKSEFSTSSKREGVYIKISDGKYIIHRFKMVRQGFKQGAFFGKEMKKNLLRKL